MTFNTLLLAIALGLTAGVIVGSAQAPLRRRRQEKQIHTEAWQRTARANRRMLRFLSSAVYTVLGIGLVWTVYFMVLGLVDRTQTEFAEQAASLIVAVLTLFSIMIAYFEFMHRNDEKAAQAETPPEGAETQAQSGHKPQRGE